MQGGGFIGGQVYVFLCPCRAPSTPLRPLSAMHCPLPSSLLPRRFLAEAPDAHTDGFRQALPFMLRIGAITASSKGAGREDPSGGVTVAAGPVQFLLPGLLQVGGWWQQMLLFSVLPPLNPCH